MFGGCEFNFIVIFFKKLNEVNLNLHGAEETHITISRKSKALTEKTSLLNSTFRKSNFGCFPTVDSNPSKFQIKLEIEETLGLCQDLSSLKLDDVAADVQYPPYEAGQF